MVDKLSETSKCPAVTFTFPEIPNDILKEKRGQTPFFPGLQLTQQ